METRQIANWGIVVAAAVVLTVLQIVAGEVVWWLTVALRVAILLGLLFFGYRLWRENRGRLSLLETRQKLLFYGAAIVIVVFILGSFLLPLSLFGAILFLIVVGGCAFVMWRIWQDAAGWY
jgi:phosphate/sulfate permease